MSFSRRPLCQHGLALLSIATLLSVIPSCGGTTGGEDDGSTDSSAATGGNQTGGNSSTTGGTKSGGAPSTGGDPSTGGHPTGGTEASGGAAGDGSGGTGMGGSAGAPSKNPECNLSLETGPCEAAFLRYGYDPESGSCVPFSYGGCEGNENNFESLEACDQACRGGIPTEVDRCETVLDCVLEPQGCCGVCEPAELDWYEALNTSYLDARRQQVGEDCGNIACGACEPGEPTSQNFGVTCERETNTDPLGHCKVYDVREVAEVSECGEDADCQLRNGLSCCGSCSGDDWVAVTTDWDVLTELFCDDMPVACPACAAIPPDDRGAACVEGICQVVPL